MRTLRFWALLSLGILPACGRSPDKSNSGMEEATMLQRPSIAEAIAKHGQPLLAIKGVTAVFEGQSPDGQPCIKIGVIAKSDSLLQSLPSALEGWPVYIEVTGEIKPLSGS